MYKHINFVIYFDCPLYTGGWYFVNITLSLSICCSVQSIVVSPVLPHLIDQFPVHHPSHLKTRERRGDPSHQRGVDPTL